MENNGYFLERKATRGNSYSLTKAANKVGDIISLTVDMYLFT